MSLINIISATFFLAKGSSWWCIRIFRTKGLHVLYIGNRTRNAAERVVTNIFIEIDGMKMRMGKVRASYGREEECLWSIRYDSITTRACTKSGSVLKSR